MLLNYFVLVSTDLGTGNGDRDKCALRNQGILTIYEIHVATFLLLYTYLYSYSIFLLSAV